jgi:hypothetical protein
VILHIDHQMRIKTIRSLRCAPGFTHQSIHIGPEHGAGMV